MKKFIIIFSPVFITAIFVSLIIFKKTIKPSPSFQALTPSVGMNTTLKTFSNTAVVEIKRDNSKLGLETPLKEVSLTKNNEEYVYQSIKDEMEIIYKPIDKGIKEEIILHKLPDLNKFSPPGSSFVEFSINMFLDNLSWGTNADGLPIFFDQSGKYQFHFQKPFAKDAKGEITTSLAYKIIPDLKPAITRGINTKVFAQTVSQRKKYTLILNINKAWLSDSKRVFPVVIDPSVVYDLSSAYPEIIEKRTVKSSTFAKGDGSFIAKLTICDQYYQDENNNWQTVNEAIEGPALTGFSYKVDKIRHAIHLTEDGKRRWYPRRNVTNEYVEFDKPEYWTGSAWATLPLGIPTRNENKITWDRTNYSLDLAVNWNRVKMDITLKSSAAARRVRWPVSLTGLTWDNWTLLSGGIVVGSVHKPNGYYLSTPGDPKTAVSVPVSVSYSGGYAEFTADLTGATYPVIIDPTFSTQPDATAGVDTVLSSSNPTYNYGVTTDCWIGYIATGRTYRWLVKFNLTDLPTDAIISAATLSFFLYGDYATVGGTWKVYRQKKAWVEGTRDHVADSPATGATWNRYDTVNSWTTAGGFDAADCEQTAIGSRAYTATETLNVFKDVSLTPTTKAALDLGYGWLVKSDVEAADDEYDGRSSDHTTASERPKLVVEYTLRPSLKFEGVKMEGVKID